MNAFKNILLFLFGGAIFGAVLGTLTGRSGISWYNSPGFGQQMIVQDPKATTMAILDSLVHAQLIGGAIGAVAGLVLGILVARRGSRLPAPTTAGPTPKP